MKRALCAGASALLLMTLASGCKNDDGQAPAPTQPAQTAAAPAAPANPSTTWETPKSAPSVSATAGPSKQTSKVVTTKSGLKYEDLVVGTGPSPKAGQTVVVKYVGTLLDGTKFDASADHGGDGTFPFAIGEGQVIPGWDEGVISMKVGGKRKLTIPANLAYGENSPTPAIPPNSTLVFTVELVAIQ